MKSRARSTAREYSFEIWQSDTATFFLDRGESVYVFPISDKQTPSNCSVDLTIKLATKENYCVSEKLAKCWSVFRKIEDKLSGFWWLSSWSFTVSAAKEKNNMEPDISYSCKNESGEKAANKSLGFELFNLRCSSSIAGLWVTFSFPLVLNLMSCTCKTELEHMNGF